MCGGEISDLCKNSPSAKEGPSTSGLHVIHGVPGTATHPKMGMRAGRVGWPVY